MQRKQNTRISKHRKSTVKRRKKEKIQIKFKFDFKYIGEIAAWIAKVICVCLLAFICVWFMGQQVSVVGDSMKPAIENGDVVLVNRVVYNATTPKRGDVVVFRPKGNENMHYYVKRVIALPGETIQIKENRIFINGEILEESYETTVLEDRGYLTEPLTLGEDEYFVLGDDRGKSEDSRHAEVGNVKRKHIYGKAWFIISGSKTGFVKEK